MIWWLLCPAALAAGTFAACGVVGLELLVGQAAVGVLLLEIINYIEARAAGARLRPIPSRGTSVTLALLHYACRQAFATNIWRSFARQCRLQTGIKSSSVGRVVWCWCPDVP